MSDNENGKERPLTLEEIKRLPPEKRIIALKKYEEEKERERKNAQEEEEHAITELETEKKENEREEVKLQEEERKQQPRRRLEDVVIEEAPVIEKKEDTGNVAYHGRDKLKDFYAVTNKVREALPGVLERVASGSATPSDERFIDNYKKAMEDVKEKAHYASESTRTQFYTMHEQLREATLYHASAEDAQQREQQKKTEDYRAA